MSCMAAEDHDRIVRRVNLWHVKFHLIWAVLLALAIYLPYHLKLERDLLQGNLDQGGEFLHQDEASHDGNAEDKAVDDWSGYGHHRCSDSAE